MKKMKNMAGALAIAVALASMTTACSNEDEFAVTETAQQAQRNVQFSINATIGDEGATRAVVETDGTTHKLKFGTGDKLFVYKQVVVGGVGKYMRGMLNATSIAADGKSATFSGSITLPAGYTGAFTPEDAVATLIPANGEDNFVINDNDDNSVNVEWKAGASQEAIDDAIAKYSYAKGTLSNTGAVTLQPGSAFLKCHITGLDAVKCYAAAVKQNNKMIGCGSVTSDASGNADFVAWIETSTTSQDYALELYYMEKKHSISLGSRTVSAKVYNATKAAGESVSNDFEILKDGNVYEKESWQLKYILTSGTFYIKGYYTTIPVSVSDNAKLILNSASLASYGDSGIGLEINSTTTLTVNGESYFSGSNYSIYASSNFTVNGKGILKSKISCNNNVSNILVDGGATVNVPQGNFYMGKDDATLTIDGGSTVNLFEDAGFSGCKIPNIIIKKGTFKYLETDYYISINKNKINHIYGPDGTTELTTYTADGNYRIYTVN